MEFGNGRIIIARQTLVNPNMEAPGGAKGPDGEPLSWGRYYANTYTLETSSFYWPPGAPGVQPTRIEVHSYADYTHPIYQYLWGSGSAMHNPGFFRIMQSPGCHTFGASAWIYIPNSTNAPTSGSMFIQAVNQTPSGGGLVSSVRCSTQPGWWWLRTGKTHWEWEAEIDSRHLYFRVAKSANSVSGTIWVAQSRVWIDEMDLSVQWKAKQGGMPGGWRYRAPNGTHHVRYTGHRDRWQLPVIDVTSSQRHKLNSWWEEGASLVMSFQSSMDLADYSDNTENVRYYYGPGVSSHYGVELPTPRPFHDVVLSGKNPPITRLDGPTGDMFKGVLDLRTTEGGFPFREGGLL
jgi:hypothetical protein